MVKRKRHGVFKQCLFVLPSFFVGRQKMGVAASTTPALLWFMYSLPQIGENVRALVRLLVLLDMHSLNFK